MTVMLFLSLIISWNIQKINLQNIDLYPSEMVCWLTIMAIFTSAEII